MAIKIVRQNDGTTTYNPSTVVVPYQVEGVVDPLLGVDPFDQIALAIMTPGFIPSTYEHPNGTLYLQDILIQENHAARIYTISVPYGIAQGPREVGAYSVTINGSGGTVNVKAGERIAGYIPMGAPATDNVDNGGLIQVDENGAPEGVDIPVEEPKLSISFRHPKGTLNAAYIRAVGQLVGYPNNDIFLGYQPGEVVYLSGPFSQTETEATAQYSFAISYNVLDLIVGNVTVAEKLGWDVLNINWKPNDDGGVLTSEIRNIEVVRPRALKDYVPVFGWGG